VLTNQAVHAIDLLLWFGGEVDQVFAMCQTRLATIEAEDTAVAVVRFSNGTLGAIEATTATRPGNLEASFSLLGAGGSVEIGGNNANRIQTWQFENPDAADASILESNADNPAHDPNYAHRCYLNEVMECIRKQCEGGVGGPEALRSLKLIHALYHSDSLGIPVPLESADFSGSRLGRNTPRPAVVSA
jgi:predicted dehydrogenase